MTDNCKGKFSARIFFFENNPSEIEVWEEGLLPMEFSKRGNAEWARECLCDYNDNDLREKLGIPKEGSYQVYFKGEMEAWKIGPYGEEEWDQDFDTEGDPVWAVISDDYLKVVLGEER